MIKDQLNSRLFLYSFLTFPNRGVAGFIMCVERVNAEVGVPCRDESSLLRGKSNANPQESQAQAACTLHPRPLCMVPEKRHGTHRLGLVGVSHTLPYRYEQLWGRRFHSLRICNFPTPSQCPPFPPQGDFHSHFLKKCFLVKLEYAMRCWSFVAEI